VSVTVSPYRTENSIRHVAVSTSGDVAIGMQWQRVDVAPSLVGLHQRGHDIRLGATSIEQLQAMKGYIGSVAFAHDQTHVVATSPRGNLVQGCAPVMGLKYEA